MPSPSSVNAGLLTSAYANVEPSAETDIGFGASLYGSASLKELPS